MPYLHFFRFNLNKIQSKNVISLVLNILSVDFPYTFFKQIYLYDLINIYYKIRVSIIEFYVSNINMYLHITAEHMPC